MVLSRFLPHKQVSNCHLSAAVRRSSAAVASLQMRTNFLLKHLQLIGLLTLPLSHSFPLGTELTEYNCQSVLFFFFFFSVR